VSGLTGKVFNNSVNFKKRSKNYNVREVGNFNYKQSCFYFSQGYTFNTKKQYKTYLLNFKKNISFFKKTENTDKWLLFWAVSRIFTDNIFTKSEFNLYLMPTRSFNKHLHQLDKETPTRALNFKYRFIKVLYENRRIFKKIFFRKNFIQRKLSNKIVNFIKLNQRSALLGLESNLENVLLRSRFFLTISHVELALTNGIVYLNGRLVKKKKKILKTSDILQLSLVNSYFYFDRFIIQDIKRLKSKLPGKIWNLFKHINNIQKQTPKHFENWYYLLYHFWLDVPKYLEVDYISLSIILIYTPVFYWEFNQFFLKYLNLSLIRLYNWKYIT